MKPSIFVTITAIFALVNDWKDPQTRKTSQTEVKSPTRRGISLFFLGN
jgi:hypothetical protein